MLPDLITAFHEIDTGPETGRAQARGGEEPSSRQDFESKAQRIHAISQLLKAYCLYEKDVQYVVQDNKVIIVDENTGRLMTGRRWSDGLHQAVEAKEGVEIERETQTLATITIQNYFRLYAEAGRHDRHRRDRGHRVLRHLQAGRAGHPHQQAVRPQGPRTIRSIRPSARNSTRSSRRSRRSTPRAGPILVGTDLGRDQRASLAACSRRTGIIHSVLNAKFHQQEAEIVARAGQRGSVTIATNMAGRGTDIKLGPGVADVGRLARHRHRAPRGAPHRPPVARPLRAPGRSRAPRTSSSRSRTT